MNAYEAYKKYVAIKLHFQGNYDYFKFSGGVKLSREKFETRNDKYFFQRIAKVYDEKQFEHLLVANFVLKKDTWIGEVLSDSGREIYLKWKKTYQSLEYLFSEDIRKIQSLIEIGETKSFDSLFVVESGSDWPDIVTFALHQEIRLETFLIMNKILNFIPRIDKHIKDELVWPEFRTLCFKYSPFLDVDVKKFRSIMKMILVAKNS